ncbi:hypothetical protein GC175_17050 [bacterium]|nr:hypothetical protein [bacterium]
MTYGAFSANVIQLGPEVTPGTAVAATTVWRGPATDIEDGSPKEFIDESAGLLVPTDRVITPYEIAMLSVPETAATFEQIMHVLEAGIQQATPSGVGPYVRDYAYGVSTPNAVRTYTLETGNKLAGDAHEMAYGIVSSFTLSGGAQEAWRLASNWTGRRKVSTTLTGALSVPSVEEMLFQRSKVYIDASGGTIGTTQVTGQLVAASVSVTTGIQAIFTGDGNLYFAAIKYTKPKVEFSLTMELKSSGQVATERTAHANRTTRLIRLGIPGATPANRNLNLDLAAKYTSVGSYQNSNENTTVQLNGEARYSSTDALFFAAKLTNQVASI